MAQSLGMENGTSLFLIRPASPIPQGCSLSASVTDKVGCEPVGGKAHLQKYSCSLTMRAKTCLLNNKFFSLTQEPSKHLKENLQKR